jgi:hypothetical protein
MSVCLDPLFFRERTEAYKCFQHADEAWMMLTGESLSERVKSYVQTGAVSLSDAKSFTVMPTPQSPCLVLMDNGPSTEMHVGVFYEDKIIHLTKREGVEYRSVADVTYGYNRVRFIR